MPEPSTSAVTNCPRHPLKLAISFAVVAALWPSAATHAQGFNLGRILKDGIQRGSAEASCERFRVWLDKVRAPAPNERTRRTDGMLAYVEDAVFKESFGKSYRELTSDDFRESQRTLADCRRLNLLTPAQASTAQSVWHQGMQAQLLRQLDAAQASRNELATVRQELEALQPTASDSARIDTLKSKGEAILRRQVHAQDQQEFLSLVAATRLRVTLPVESQRADQAIAEAKGLAGITDLASQLERLGASGLPAQALAPLRDRLGARLNALALEAAPDFRGLLTPPGADLARFAQHTTSVRDFDQRFAKVMAQAPALAAVARDARGARQPSLPQVMADVERQVRSANDGVRIKALLTQHFLDDELSTSAGSALRGVADDRSKLLQRLSADIAFFGPQPEHEQLLAGHSPQTAAPAPGPQPTRCDLLAAHPDDPDRISIGTPDDRMDVKAAITACEEAVRQSPRSGRLQFQWGRALLDGGRAAEAVAALKRAADLQHAGAYFYLSEAAAGGAPGVAKNAKLSEQYAQKARSLSWGGPAKALANQAPTFAEADYEDMRMVKAVYFGDSSLLDGNRNYVFGYLIAQADLLSQIADCRQFKLTEVQGYRNEFIRRQVPANQNDMVRMGLEHLKNTVEGMQIAMTNPRALADAAASSQREQSAGIYGAKDLERLAGSTGGCAGAAMKRYTKNLRHYFNR